jgi:hypothetical protein
MPDGVETKPVSPVAAAGYDAPQRSQMTVSSESARPALVPV